MLAGVAKYPACQVYVTGGEPLSQEMPAPAGGCAIAEIRRVAGNLGGARHCPAVDPRVSRIMDLKAPDSGAEIGCLWSASAYLDERDEIKIIACWRL